MKFGRIFMVLGLTCWIQLNAAQDVVATSMPQASAQTVLPGDAGFACHDDGTGLNTWEDIEGLLEQARAQAPDIFKKEIFNQVCFTLNLFCDLSRCRHDKYFEMSNQICTKVEPMALASKKASRLEKDMDVFWKILSALQVKIQEDRKVYEAQFKTTQDRIDALRKFLCNPQDSARPSQVEE